MRVACGMQDARDGAGAALVGWIRELVRGWGIWGDGAGNRALVRGTSNGGGCSDWGLFGCCSLDSWRSESGRGFPGDYLRSRVGARGPVPWTPVLPSHRYSRAPV